jgi:glycosyltransferase involved in cell wall biosynthesis
VTYLLDARPLQDRNAGRGVGSYVRGLLEGLRSVGADRSVEVLLSASPVPPEVAEYDLRTAGRRLPVMRRRLRPVLDPLVTSVALAGARPALFHTLDFRPPVYARMPVVVTVHDLIPFVFASAYPRLRRERFFALQLLRFADALITDSESSARDIARFARIDRERIDVVPLGVSALPEVAADTGDETLARLGVRGPYLLAVGVFDPRKRIEHVVEIAAEVRRHHDVQLVVVGEQGYFDGAVRASVAEAGMTERTKILGFVPRADLVTLYRRAACLLFTSAYEGFGLPPLEAMAAGAPVAMYENSSLPEIAGDAALMAADGDSVSLAAMVVEMLGDPQLVELRRRQGERWAARFTWERTATETLSVYERVLARS